MEPQHSQESNSLDTDATQPLAEVVNQSLKGTHPDKPILDTVPLGDISKLLTTHPPEVQQRMTIQFGQYSDVGRVRKRNEDSCFSFVAQAQGDNALIPFALFLIADGMGGHVDGHEASRTVAYQVAHYVIERVYLPLLSGQIRYDSIQEIMARAVDVANRSIKKNEPEEEGGTTLTGALIIGKRLYIVHVGDTRAYLLTDGELSQVTTDHTIVKRLEDAGHLTSEQAAIHPNRNLLYRAITGKDLEEVDTYTRSLPENGYIILCSDGVWEPLAQADQLKPIAEDESLSLHQRCKKMVDTALDLGSTDNVTSILIQFRL